MMCPKLVITKTVLERFEQINKQCSGCLFGLFYDGTLLILGFNIETSVGQLNYKDIQYNFPAEVDLCGLVNFGFDPDKSINQIIKDVDITDNPVILQCSVGTLVDLKASVYMHEKLQNISFDVMEKEELLNNFCFTRLRYSFPLILENYQHGIDESINQARKALASGSLAFNITGTDVFLSAGSSGTISSYPSKTNIHNTLNLVKSLPIDFVNVKRSVENEYDIINVNVLKNNTNNLIENVQVLDVHINRKSKILAIPLEIDALAMLYKKTKITALYNILIESICRSFRLITESIINQIRCNNDFDTPQIYHYLPPELMHFLSNVYFKNSKDDDTANVQKRKKLHHYFGLPLNKPYFRKLNKFLFEEDMTLSPLIGPHIGLKPSGIKKGKLYMVQGKYSYYHYMQQDVNDYGWGCAYRSIQTICSWFKFQGYMNIEIPTLEEIQKILVLIGDKPENFIGSKNWIGSYEVSLFLNEFLKIESKIISLNSGSEMSNMSYDLAMHFKTNGTPIMIGGGVLAQTILGIDFNDTTKEIKFLVLDPHYVGRDDLNIIQSKGWCGWKGPGFWRRDSFYNLCLPQRPTTY